MLNEEIGHGLICERKEHVREVKDNFSCHLQVPSHVLMSIQHSTSCSPLWPLGEACSRKDLTAIHEILENIGYKDDEGVANEVL